MAVDAIAIADLKLSPAMLDALAQCERNFGGAWVFPRLGRYRRSYYALLARHLVENHPRFGGALTAAGVEVRERLILDGTILPPLPEGQE